MATFSETGGVPRAGHVADPDASRTSEPIRELGDTLAHPAHETRSLFRLPPLIISGENAHVELPPLRLPMPAAENHHSIHSNILRHTGSSSRTPHSQDTEVVRLDSDPSPRPVRHSARLRSKRRRLNNNAPLVISISDDNEATQNPDSVDPVPAVSRSVPGRGAAVPETRAQYRQIAQHVENSRDHGNAPDMRRRTGFTASSEAGGGGMSGPNGHSGTTPWLGDTSLMRRITEAAENTEARNRVSISRATVELRANRRMLRTDSSSSIRPIAPGASPARQSSRYNRMYRSVAVMDESPESGQTAHSRPVAQVSDSEPRNRTFVPVHPPRRIRSFTVTADSRTALAFSYRQTLRDEMNTAIARARAMTRTHVTRMSRRRLHGYLRDIRHMAVENERRIRQRNAAPKEVIEALPELIATDIHTEIRCPICMCDVEVGETLRELPCTHKYHKACIGEWLVRNATCPLDKKRICPFQGTNQSGLR